MKRLYSPPAILESRPTTDAEFRATLVGHTVPADAAIDLAMAAAADALQRFGDRAVRKLRAERWAGAVARDLIRRRQ